MKLIVFGSTGSVGRQIVLQALAMSHEVTAFARNPLKLSDIRHPRLCIFQGDVLSADDVFRAIPGHDAVLCAVGDGRTGRVRAEGTVNIINSMERSAVRRLICETTLGAGSSRGNLNFFWRHIMFGFLLKEALRDHELQEEHILRSRLDWTIVRPGAFTNGKLTGHYRHGFPPTEKRLALKISRPDVARFMLAQLADETYLRQTPGLSY